MQIKIAEESAECEHKLAMEFCWKPVCNNCVVNFRFTENDIQIVQQCFKYTATVLTSTLAFQNERKLKNQTQVC